MILLTTFTLGHMITAVIILLIAGMIVYFINRFAPIGEMFKVAIYMIIFIGVLIALLNFLGVWKL